MSKPLKKRSRDYFAKRKRQKKLRSSVRAKRRRRAVEADERNLRGFNRDEAAFSRVIDDVAEDNVIVTEHDDEEVTDNVIVTEQDDEEVTVIDRQEFNESVNRNRSEKMVQCHDPVKSEIPRSSVTIQRASSAVDQKWREQEALEFELFSRRLDLLRAEFNESLDALVSALTK